MHMVAWLLLFLLTPFVRLHRNFCIGLLLVLLTLSQVVMAEGSQTVAEPGQNLVQLPGR